MGERQLWDAIISLHVTSISYASPGTVMDLTEPSILKIT